MPPEGWIAKNKGPHPHQKSRATSVESVSSSSTSNEQDSLVQNLKYTKKFKAFMLKLNLPENHVLSKYYESLFHDLLNNKIEDFVRHNKVKGKRPDG